MSYPGPPGLPKNSSLPPRPPPTKLSGFKPAFPQAPPGFSAAPKATAVPAYSSAPSYGAAAGTSGGPGTHGPRAPPPTTSYSSYPTAPGVTSAGYGRAPTSYNTTKAPYQRPQAANYFGASNTGYGAAPQIRNPFPAPNTTSAHSAAASDYNPEMAAQIAQWQSAYMPKDPADQQIGKGPSGRPGATGAGAIGVQSYGPDATAIAAAATPAGGDSSDPNEKKKTVYREGGGKKWQDETLLEWDPTHLRLFVGNLAGETTDESLLKAFSQWKSVQRAKVIREKRTKKSKGYGFVSFSDPDDFFHAAREMNGKYIQSHPVVVHKAKTEVKPAVVKDDRRNGKNKNKGGGGKKSGNGMGADDSGSGAYQPHLGPVGGGITKPGQKTRGGLKLLG